jgi:hypothetical protein
MSLALKKNNKKSAQSIKFGICDVVGLVRTLVEAKIRTFECPKGVL